MNPTRREMIVGLTAAGLATACGKPSAKDSATGGTTASPEPAPDRPAEPAPWAAPGSFDPDAFGYGVTSGDATADGVLIHVRTDEVGCSLVAMAQDGEAWTEAARITDLDPTGIEVRHELTGLAADTAHSYALYAADGTRRSEVGRFRTAPAPGAAPRKLVLIATSCWGTDNPEFASLGQAAGRSVDLSLLLGDAIYASASTEADYREQWGYVLEKESVRALLGSASVIATWDDHEVANNWVLNETVTPDRVQAATDSFREAIPQRIGPGGSGIWRVLPLGDIAEVFVLDSRGERAPGRIVSDEQLTAITAAIRASTATFKLVLCSVHLTDHSAVFGAVEASDRWQGYPEQREALVRACEETPGTFVLTGDMHYSGVQLVGRADEPGDALIEIAAGPAGSEILPLQGILDLAVEPVDQYLWAGTTWTTTVLTLDPGTGEAIAEFIDDDGTVVHEHRWMP